MDNCDTLPELIKVVDSENKLLGKILRIPLRVLRIGVK